MCVQPMPLSFDRQLKARSQALAKVLSHYAPPNRVVGVYVENSEDWTVLDFTIAQSQLISVPIPEFFTSAQKDHLFTSQSISAVVASPARVQGLNLSGWDSVGLPGSSGLQLFLSNHRGSARFHSSWSGKLTFTSGSTGSPKPVALNNEQLWSVAQSIAQMLLPIGIKRHLCMLPLSILLENIAGLYTALLLGAEVVFASPERTGLVGSSRFDARTALQTISEVQAHSVIVLPEMLKSLVELGETQGLGSHHLKFMAVGGGKVAPDLITRAKNLGLPVYEGYGLSEAASVVSVNCPGAERVGSVGKPFSHVSVQIANDGEILIRTQTRDPITGQRSELEVTSGDLGRFDSDGYLHVLGRKKNLLITGFGRNVSPEWPEAALTSFPVLAQAFVFGDGQPSLSALLVARSTEVTDQELAQAVVLANTTLPDYAQITAWRRSDLPFTAANGLLTPTGKLRRDAIFERLVNTSQNLEPFLPGEDRDDIVLSGAR